MILYLKLEKWWLDWAYLEWREPVIPYVNTGGIKIDSKRIIDSYEDLRQYGLDVQAARAAVLVFAYVKFFEQLRKYTLSLFYSKFLFGFDLIIY